MIHLAKDATLIGVMFGAGVVIDEKSLVPLGTLAAAITAAFWLGRKIQNVLDQMKTQSEKITMIEQRLGIVDEVKDRVEQLPCLDEDVCKWKEQQKQYGKPLKMQQ